MPSTPHDERASTPSAGGSYHQLKNPRSPMSPTSSAKSQKPTDEENKSVTETPRQMAVHLVLRRSRLGLFTLMSIVPIVALIVVFVGGFELTRFNSSDKSTDQQSSLLDRYNSYSGTVSSALGKPIELFVSLSTQVIVLQMISSSVLSAQPPWVASIFPLALSTGAGYLVSNGFNALNVQLRPRDVKPVISEVDLSLASNTSDSPYVNRSTSVNQTISELTRLNPVSNTVLRSVVLAREQKLGQLQCSMDLQTKNIEIPDDLVHFGFPQHDWMDRMLPEAVNATTLKVVVNATESSANAGVQAADLPMSASIATNLFMNAAILMDSYIPAGGNQVWFNEIPSEIFYSQSSSTQPYATVTITEPSAAELCGIAPPVDSPMDELAKRKLFLNKSSKLLAKQLEDVTNTSHTDIGMEFSHVQISDNIIFDALTIETQIDPSLLGVKVRGDPAFYHPISEDTQCGPWGGLCVVDKFHYGGRANTYDPPSIVDAFSICLNNNGTEILQPFITVAAGRPGFNFVCNNGTSNSSILLVSVAKRLVADALIQHKFVNNTDPDDITLSDAEIGSVVKNPRKIFTFTIARLSWKLQDLADYYNAECDVHSSQGCRGLRFDLASPINSTNTTKQQLVVSGDALPLNRLAAAKYIQANTERQRTMSLVRVYDPPVLSDTLASQYYDPVVGDVLLPHNVREIKWNSSQLCDGHVEDRVQQVLNNHLYMEHTLQSTYTSALFFLFQNAVVRDVVKLNKNRETLNFANNIQPVAVWISVPKLNAWLTIGGCALLLVALLYIAGVGWLTPSKKQDAEADVLGTTSDPHVIARVLMDESQFPPLLVDRRVAFDDIKAPASGRPADELVIDSLTLRSTDAGAGA